MNVAFKSSDDRKLDGEFTRVFCGATGQLTRLVDVVSPRYSTGASISISTDPSSSQGELTAISLREGYPVDETWHLLP